MQNQKSDVVKSKILILIVLIEIYNFKAQVLPESGLCAHRGASFSHPENTLTAFKEAIRLGVQMIEFDVRMTKDSVLVIAHNSNLEKTTGHKKSISDLLFSELRALNTGLWKGEKFKGEKIPTLEETLNIIPSNIWMNIHIKSDKVTAVKTAIMLKKRNQLSNAILAIDGDAANAVREIDSSFIICCMDRKDSPHAYIEETLRIKADFIQLTEREFSILDELIPILKKNNIKINFYYADDVEKAKYLFKSGVDFILVNDIAKVLSHVNIK